MLSRVVVISDQSVARGGAEAMAVASAILLANAGISVTYFCGDAGDAPPLIAAGVDVVAVGGAHILQAPKASAFLSGLYSRRSRRALARWIADHDDAGVIYHIHSWSKILSPSIFDALRGVQHRVVIHAHDFFILCPNGGFTNYQTHTGCELLPMSRACLASNCDKRSYPEKLWRVGRQKIREHYFDLKTSPATYLLVHRGMAPFFHRAGVPEAQISVVRNPVEMPSGVRVKAEHNRIVCFVGRLDPEKGALDAAQAAKLAGVPLRIIGDGVERAHLAQVNPQAEITGWCEPHEVAMHLASARLLVVPSRWRETFGLAVVEALRQGVPVVISNTALISQDVVESEAGLAINTQDIAGFAALLSHLAEADDEIRSMSERAIAAAALLAQAAADWRDALLAHYQTVLACGTRRAR